MCRKFAKKIQQVVKDMKGDLANRQKDDKFDAVLIKIPTGFFIFFIFKKVFSFLNLI